jgi:ABC-type glycerol-3-phosphate transport system substrate-binding protein
MVPTHALKIYSGGMLMKKALLTLAAAIPMVMAGQAMAADTVLTISSWAAPVHTMNKHVFPWMISEMEKCSGGSLSAKVEYGPCITTSPVRHSS